jgi:hypothetical protein
MISGQGNLSALEGRSILKLDLARAVCTPTHLSMGLSKHAG